MNMFLKKACYFYSLVFVGMLIFICFPNSYALDINNKRFTHVTSLDGLSSNHVISILKDSRGYIWVGTNNGLDRYDGYDIKSYKSSETNHNSISNISIWSLHEDRNGNIWIGTQNGLNKFDVKTEKFRNISDEQNINEGTIYSLLANGDNLWTGADGGFFCLDINSHIIERVFSEHVVYDIAIKDEYLWLASYGRIFRYSLNSGKIHEYNLPSVAQVADIISYKNMLLLGTDDGVVYFDIKTGTIDPKSRLLPNVYVYEMLIDDYDNVWIGTRLYGLYVYSMRNKKLDKVFSTAFDEFHLQSNDVAAIMIDNNNNLWVGSGSGLSYTSFSNSLSFFRAANGHVISNLVYQLTMDKTNGLWIATEKGVSLYSNQKTTHYEIGAIRKVFISDSFVLAYADNHVYKYNKEKDIFQVYSLGELVVNKYGVKFIRDIIQIGEAQYLLATWRGLILWNTNDNTLLKVNYKKKPIFNILIEGLFQYQELILLGTTSGLYEFNKELMKINKYLIGSKLTLLDKTRIEYMDLDNNDYLWLSTDKGLFKVKDRQVIDRYAEGDGLPDTNVRSSVIVDDIIWVSTDRGIGAFQIKNNQFKKIHLNTDQFNVKFNGGVVYKSKDYLYFGGMEGVLYFKPEKFTDSATPPSINITDLHLYNKPVLPGTELLPNAISFTDHLVLKYDQNMLTFEFSSMNYNRLNHLYAYQMEGLTNNNDWIVTDEKNRRATFTPSPGEYTFRVKSGWDNNTWSDEIAEVKVTILPPWWRTNWAYTSYIILTLISLIIIYQIRTRSMRLRAIELENQVEERTTEVQTQKETIEQLMDKKNEMFANISHELRTPITLIHGPIHQTLERFSYANEVEPLIMAERNAQRLSFLVDQLLQLSRMYEFPDESKHIYSLSKIATAISSSFQSLSTLQHLSYFVKIEPDIYVSALPNAIDTILINLISNAFKYTEKEGQIRLKITKTHSKAIISIKDTGIGMPEDKLQNIFDRFTRIESEMNKKVQGVGVGLALVKQLVKLHEGEITVNSKEGEGTEFIVELNTSEPPTEISSNDETLGQDSIKQINYIESQFQNSHEQSLKQLSVQEDNTTQTQALLKPKLLIIDDTDDMRDYLESLLSTQYQCILTNNGEEGITIANEENPDIIILDVMMPGISGFDVLDRLREDLLTSHIPILLLTAKGDRESKILGLSKLADDYITKPFDAEELKARIHSILVIRQLQQRKIQKLIDDNKGNEKEWTKAGLSLKEKEFLNKLNVAMENNYHNEKFTVVDLANKIHISDRALQYKLRGLLGKAPNEFIRESRLNKAKELILTGKVNTAELAESVGFADTSYFHRCFKAYVGCTPKQFVDVKDD